MLRHFTMHHLPVTVADDANELGRAAARRFAEVLTGVLAEKGRASVILATGNSQLPFVRALRDERDIDWSRVTVFHMDEYLGMAASHPASFRRWLTENIVEPFSPQAFHGIVGDAEPVDAELRRYAALLRDEEPDITVMGIGENGHLAFNDPPADFDTPELIHVVELDHACRMQQVGEGHFPSLAATPTQALSLTIPMLLRPRTVLVLVPEQRKADATARALEGPVTPDCPASLLQTVSNAELYLDAESASLLTVPAEG
ncbi:MAG TPA: glucosamine-6-phosphate deaminase [Propionibacteriaceae bacterium]|nr:glucosamine-6-phosphate deaminase [Propionibacteriaceae bacterium]